MHLDDLASSGLLKGDLESLNAWKKVSEVHKDYVSKFELSKNNQGGDALLKQLNSFAYVF